MTTCRYDWHSGNWAPEAADSVLACVDDIAKRIGSRINVIWQFDVVGSLICLWLCQSPFNHDLLAANELYSLSTKLFNTLFGYVRLSVSFSSHLLESEFQILCYVLGSNSSALINPLCHLSLLAPQTFRIHLHSVPSWHQIWSVAPDLFKSKLSELLANISGFRESIQKGRKLDNPLILEIVVLSINLLSLVNEWILCGYHAM